MRSSFDQLISWMLALGVAGLRHAHQVEGVDALAVERIPASV